MANPPFRTLAIATITLAFCGVTVAEAPRTDWPQWRGPAHNGISSDPTELLNDWPEAGPPVLWSRDLGCGYSSFAVADDRAYTQAQTAFGQYVLCLDANNGTTIWEHSYDWPYEGGGLYPGPRATPTIVQQRLYFAAPDGTVGCLETRSGRPLWSVNVIEKYRGAGVEFGYSCSPVWVDGKIILPVGGRSAAVVALDAETGKTLWTTGEEPASYSTPLPIQIENRELVVVLLQNSLLVVDSSDGAIVWRHRLSAGYDEHSAAPLFADRRLMISSPFRAGADQFECHSSDNVLEFRRTWFSRELSNDVAASVLSQGAVYGFDLRDIQSKLHRPSRGTFRCLDWQTGKTLWSTDRVGQSSIIVADGKLILFSDSGEVILAEENSTSYVELARTRVFGDEICWTAPALSQGRLYLRTNQRAVCLDLRRTVRELPRPATRVADIATRERWDLTRLVGGEREAPFDLPEPDELRVWFVASLLTFGLAAGGALLFWRVRPNMVRPAFWLLLFIAGGLAGPIANRMTSEYVLTWPVSLFAFFQATVLAAIRAEQQPDRRRARWRSRAMMGVFLLLCIGYLLLCQRLGMVMEGVFLIGFGPAFPVAAIAGWRQYRSRCSLLESLFWAIAGFCMLFGSTAAYLQWRALVLV